MMLGRSGRMGLTAMTFAQLGSDFSLFVSE